MRSKLIIVGIALLLGIGFAEHTMFSMEVVKNQQEIIKNQVDISKLIVDHCTKCNNCEFLRNH